MNGNPRSTYRTITGRDVRDNVTAEELGARVVRTGRTFEAKTGRLTGIAAATATPGAT